MKKFNDLASGQQTEQESQGAIVPEVVGFEELSYEEEQECLQLERIVERSFVEAGRALRQLRDKRLYRNKYKTFEEYVRVRFNFSRRRPYFLIDAAAVVDNLEKCDPMDHKNWKLPTNERQVRPLIRLEPDEQIEAWTQACSTACGKVPPARIVKDVVQQIRERHPVPNPWHIDDVATIIGTFSKSQGGLAYCQGTNVIILLRVRPDFVSPLVLLK